MAVSKILPKNHLYEGGELWDLRCIAVLVKGADRVVEPPIIMKVGFALEVESAGIWVGYQLFWSVLA